MKVVEFNHASMEPRIPTDPAERVAYELWSMDVNDDRRWANHLRQLARSQGNDGKRIDADAYRALEWPPVG